MTSRYVVCLMTNSENKTQKIITKEAKPTDYTQTQPPTLICGVVKSINLYVTNQDDTIYNNLF